MEAEGDGLGAGLRRNDQRALLAEAMTVSLVAGVRMRALTILERRADAGGDGWAEFQPEMVVSVVPD